MKAFIVEHGFGVLRPGVERRVGEQTLRMYVDDGGVVYERVGGPRLRVAVDELLVVPAPPVLAEPRLSNYIMLRLPEPLYLPRGVTRSLKICMPVDVAVVPRGSNMVLDAAPARGIVKYAVYGEIDRGMLTRYVRVGVGGECSEGEAEVRLVFRVVGEAIVNRVVVPAHFLNLCVSGSKVTGARILVNIADGVASIHPGGIEDRGCEPAPQLVKAPLLERQRFLMIHGL